MARLRIQAMTRTLLAVVFAVYALQARAQNAGSQGSDLFKTVEALDTRLFTAYNTCDLATVGSMVAEDLEFFHDKTGFAQGRQPLVDGVKNNICGKVHRELVAGSLEVYPLAGYGAVEIGVHRFTHPGQPDNIGEAKFITIWHEKDGVWQISRAISFDHRPL